MTKVFKGSGEIHTKMWKKILKKQLKVRQEYFNGIVFGGKRLERSECFLSHDIKIKDRIIGYTI